jgi:hypothetical protein
VLGFRANRVSWRATVELRRNTNAGLGPHGGRPPVCRNPTEAEVSSLIGGVPETPSFVQAGVRVTDDFVAGKLTLNARARPPVTSLRISRRARGTVISCPVAHSGADGYERLESCSALLVVLRSPVASCRPGCRRILSGYALRRESAVVRARRAPDGARRAVVGLAWLRVVDGSAEAVGDRVAGVLVEPAGL